MFVGISPTVFRMTTPLIQYLGTLSAAFFAVLALVLTMVRLATHRSQSRPDDSPCDDGILGELLAKYGKSSNSIYHRYGEFKHLEIPLTPPTQPMEKALLGYATKGRIDVLLTDPLCAEGAAKEVLTKFKSIVESQGRKPMLFAIDSNTATAAKSIGFKILKIGQEPTFDLESYSLETLPAKLRSSIRQVFKKGISIEEVKLEDLQLRKIAQPLNELLHHWFMTRGSEAFKLLTEVNPVRAAQDKKFFVARSEHHIEGFLACSKVYARNGFMIHDLIRAPVSINGVADALVATALDTLKTQGYTFATLGVSPLSGLGTSDPKVDFPRIQKLLHLIFEKVSVPYRFKELYHFKKKFHPTAEIPVYLAVPSSIITPIQILTILGLFSSLNPIRAIAFMVRKWRFGYNLPKPLAWALNPRRILLPPLSNLSLEVVAARLKFTISMVLLNVYTYLYTSDFSGRIDSDVLQRFGFSYATFADHKWFVIVSSNFVHFDMQHLGLNMMFLLIFGGALEILGGSTLAAFAFLFGLQSNIPTGLVLLPILKTVSPSLFEKTAYFVDVGASLGVMSCFGALAYLLKPKVSIFMILSGISFFLIYSIVGGDLIGLDHAIAVICGYSIAHIYLNSQPSQKVFKQTDNRFFHFGGKDQKQSGNHPLRIVQKE